MKEGVLPAERGVVPRLSVMMFLEFFVWGGWYVTVGNYMGAHGMTKEIFWAYSVCPIAAIVSPFFLGMVADRFFASERVLAVMHLLGGILLLAAPMTAGISPTAFIWLLLAYSLTFMPTLGLTNTVALHHIASAEKQFPLIRVFGTIGWIVAGFMISSVLHADTRPLQFYITGAAAILLGVFSFVLPHTPAPAAGQKAAARDILGLDTIALMKEFSFSVFVIGSFLVCIPLAFYYAYAPVFVSAMKIADPAGHMLWGQIFEVFFMLIMPILFVRLGVKWMLTLGMFAWVLRYGLFAAAANNHLLWMVMGGIILHGVCYDFFFVTGQIYIDQKASENIRAQAQGFIVLVTQGIGMLIGAQVAGMIFDRTAVNGATNWYMLWLLPCLAAGVIMVLFAAMFRENGKRVPVPEPA